MTVTTKTRSVPEREAKSPVRSTVRRQCRATAAVVVAAAALTCASATLPAGAVASLAPGIYVNGPEAIEFNTPYSYQVTVLTNRSYRQAAVGVTTFGCSHKWFVNLTAHRPWRRSFPMIFSANNFRELPAVLAAVVSPASKQPPYAHTLLHARFPLTALPDATTSAEPPPSSYPFCDAPGGM